MSDEIVKIIQLSDIHLLDDPQGKLLEVRTEESLHQVIRHIRQRKEKPDLIIISGDLTNDGTDVAYRRLANELKIFELPIYCIPGNHDDIEMMNRVFPHGTISDKRQVILSKWQIILLSSKKPHAVEGLMDATQLNFLEQCLQSRPDLYAMIVFHHEPLSVGSPWLDEIGLTNARDFWNIIERFANVKLIAYGHIHQVNEQIVNGIPCLSTPSTCIQFKPKQEFFTLEKLPPGYRWINLYPDGHIESEVIRIPQYVGKFGKHLEGY